MWADILFSLRQELMVMGILFLLLFVKIGAAAWRAEGTLYLINLLLLANLILGLFPGGDSTLFSGMFHTDRLIVLEKNMLNLATLIVSLQAYSWLKGHRQVLEFYMLLLSTLLGFFFMISA